MTGEVNHDVVWPIGGGVRATGETADALAKLLKAAGEAPALIIDSPEKQTDTGVKIDEVLNPEECSKLDALLESVKQTKPIILGE